MMAILGIGTGIFLILIAVRGRQKEALAAVAPDLAKRFGF
jgi:hypothetical protein